MKIKYIKKLSNTFYSLAVPLDDLISTPHAKRKQFHQENIENYRIHFQHTTIPYKIFYVSDLLINLFRDRGYKGVKDIDKVKSDFDVITKDLISKKLGPSLSGQQIINIIEELDILDAELSSSSVNIIGNVLIGQVDTEGPSALSHDLGHLIEDKIQASTDQLLDAFIEDYEFYSDGVDILKAGLINQANLIKAVREMVPALIGKVFTATETIAKDNLANMKAFDILPDFLTEYHVQGDTLDKIKDKKIEGLNFYFKVKVGTKGKYTTEDDPNVTTESHLLKIDENEKLVIVAPKNYDLPNFNKAIKDSEVFNQLSSMLSNQLKSFIGKVVTLW